MSCMAHVHEMQEATDKSEFLRLIKTCKNVQIKTECLSIDV